MTEPLEVYPLVQRDGRWWLPYGPKPVQSPCLACSAAIARWCSLGLMAAALPMTSRTRGRRWSG